jgi:hypothetical protein
LHALAGRSAILRTGDLAVSASGVNHVPLRPGSESRISLQGRGAAMGSTTIIQVVAGVLFVVILIVLIQRRRTRVK